MYRRRRTDDSDSGVEYSSEDDVARESDSVSSDSDEPQWRRTRPKPRAQRPRVSSTLTSILGTASGATQLQVKHDARKLFKKDEAARQRDAGVAPAPRHPTALQSVHDTLLTRIAALEEQQKKHATKLEQETRLTGKIDAMEQTVQRLHKVVKQLLEDVRGRKEVSTRHDMLFESVEQRLNEQAQDIGDVITGQEDAISARAELQGTLMALMKQRDEAVDALDERLAAVEDRASDTTRLAAVEDRMSALDDAPTRLAAVEDRILAVSTLVDTSLRPAWTQQLELALGAARPVRLTLDEESEMYDSPQGRVVRVAAAGSTLDMHARFSLDGTTWVAASTCSGLQFFKEHAATGHVTARDCSPRA